MGVINLYVISESVLFNFMNKNKLISYSANTLAFNTLPIDLAEG